MDQKFKKKIIVLSGICLFLMALVVLLQMVSERQVLQQRAAGTGQMKFTLASSNWNIETGGTKNVDLMVTNSGADTAIFTAGAEIKFNSTHFSVDSVACNSAESLSPFKNEVVDAGAGFKKIALTCFTPVSGDGLAIVSGGTKKIGSFVINCSSDQALVGEKSTFDFIETLIPSGGGADISDGGTDKELTIVASAGGATNTPTPIPACNTAPTGTDEVKLCAAPKERTVLGKNNQPITSPVQEIWFNSGSKSVKYVKMILSHSHDKLNITGASFKNGFTGTYKVASENADHIILEATNSGVLTGRQKVAELTMSVKGDKPSGGATYVYLCGMPNTSYNCQTASGANLPYKSEINDSAGSDTSSQYNIVLDSPDDSANKLLRVNFTAYGTGAANTPIPPGGATNTPTPTGTVPPGSEAVLNFSVRFQGVDSGTHKPTDANKTQKLSFRVKKGNFEKVFTDVDAVYSDTNGNWTGSVTLTGVTPGEGYAVFIKGPKHLAKKFCTNNQTRRCVTEGSLALNSGKNEYDFTTLPLEAGDLPNPNQGGKQDGVANSVDYSLARDRWLKNTAQNLAIADVNFDGVINSADTTLIRETIETRYEEDF